jgi:hypothetical protein
MAMNDFVRLIDKAKVIVGCPPAALATTAGDGDYVSMKGYDRLTIIISVDNATTVTGGAITLLQATDVAATGAKALGFSTVYANIDVGAGEALTETAVTSNTFTTTTVDNKNSLYVIELQASDLDVDNNFDCVRVDSASMANAVGSVIYILHGQRYSTGVTATAD